jgi:hypothetical protein
MKNKLRLLAMIPIGIFALTAILQANNAVRVVSDLTGITANMGVSHNNMGDQISLSVPAIALNSITLNGQVYQTVSLPEGDHVFAAELAEEGKPDLPVLTTMLAIPDQAGIQLDVSFSGYDSIENIDVAPVQPSPSDASPNDPIPFTLDQQTYSSDAFYPGDLATADDPVIMRDVRGVALSINPVQYNPVKKELRVYRDLAISVSYGGVPVNPKTTRTPYLSEGFYPMYKSMFANFDQMFSGAEVKRGGYLIICRPPLVDSLKALAMWKHQKGYTTRIVPTTEINSNGAPTAAQIFTYLQTAYHTWEVPPEYVMLVGDVDGTWSVADYPYSNGNTYPSDQHYSQVDGSDFLPDIFVSRLSVDAMSQLRIAVSKIFKYEKTPRMIDAAHWTRGFACGYNLWPGMRYTTLWVRELALHNGFSQVDTVYGTGPDPSPAVIAIMNTGPGMIWYRGEGGVDGWWGVGYRIAQLNAMPNNQNLGVCTPMTCGLGDFSANECFGETWIRMGFSVDSLKGGPAFYGVSDHFTNTKWNNPIMIGYFFGIFGSNIYHFAAAAVAGKLQDYRTFPQNRQVEVQQYFNTYNMQGDPELELRTKIPILLNVTHPDTLGFGLNYIDINVVDTAGNPINQAYVTLVKMADTTEELYSIGKTDENGNIELSFDALTPGNMTLTVSGQNLYPYQSQVHLVPLNIAVGFDSLFIDDDMSGFSRGNGDSLANPGETLELYASLKNFGDSVTANNITTNLTSLSGDMAEILDGTGNYGSIAPGQSVREDHPYLVKISPNAQDGDIIQLKQQVTDQNNDSWYSVIEIPIEAPLFYVSRAAIQDANNRLDPGDTVNMVLTIINRGHDEGLAVTGSISTDDDYARVIDSQTSFGDMPVGDTASSALDSLVFAVDRGAFAGRRINFTLNTVTSLGAKAAVPFSVPVDSLLASTDPTGPDAYGYYMYDKTDTGYALHPTYSWVELAPGLGGQGTRLNYGGNTDDHSVLITLPFNFVYYGNPYGVLIVCTNGFVSPDTDRYDMGGNYWADFFNWPIPDPGNCRAQISPFWDDLQVSTSGNYGVFTWSDTTNHRYLIEWNHVTNRNTSGPSTFEMIIYDPVYYPTVTGDAQILYQYSSITNNDVDENYATVGFESWDQLTGVEYTHDNRYDPGAATITSNFAILATTNTGRGGIKGMVNLNNGGQNGGVVITALSGQHRTTSPTGDYWIKSVPLGMTSVTAQIDGYFPGRLDSINVISDQTADSVNFNLTVCPVPQNLIASDTLANRIEVRWDAVTHGDLAGYDLYKSRWQAGGFEKLNTTPILVNHYTDSSPSDSAVYWYYVTAVYSNIAWGTVESFNSNMDSGSLYNPTGINGDNLIPKEFFLSQNYPNPFNPTTTISYGLPKDSNVKIDIFNLLGQKVMTLVDDREKAGYKSLIWSGKDNAGQSVSSGVYFYRIDTGDRQLTKKMMLLK